MKWTLSQLQKYRNKDLIIDEMVTVEDIQEDETTIREVLPVHITGRADLDSSRVTFHLKLKGHMILPCSRTLVDVKHPINVETTETFLLNVSDYETEEDAHQVNGDVIDLMPVIREIILLEVPMQVFCDDLNSEEGAPQAGKDWVVIREEDQTKKADPRLAALAKFFDDNDSNSD